MNVRRCRCGVIVRGTGCVRRVGRTKTWYRALDKEEACLECDMAEDICTSSEVRLELER